MKKVLNVGGNNKSIALPAQYQGWQHVLLDIDPKGQPDVVCDARLLTTLAPNDYDSVYCSHNLEHYHHHEVSKVLAGFMHVLKPEGFAFIRVPDMAAVMQTVVEKQLDIDDVLYQSNAGPILVRDVIYGFGKQIERSGCDFYAHKTGFTEKSLFKTLYAAKFPNVYIGKGNLELKAFAFKAAPTEQLLKDLSLRIV